MFDKTERSLAAIYSNTKINSKLTDQSHTNVIKGKQWISTLQTNVSLINYLHANVIHRYADCALFTSAATKYDVISHIVCTAERPCYFCHAITCNTQSVTSQLLIIPYFPICCPSSVYVVQLCTTSNKRLAKCLQVYNENDDTCFSLTQSLINTSNY